MDFAKKMTNDVSLPNHKELLCILNESPISDIEELFTAHQELFESNVGKYATPLHWAIAYRRHDLIVLFSDLFPAETTNDHYGYPFAFAVTCSDKETFALTLQQSNWPPQNKGILMNIAVNTQHADKVEMVAEYGAQVCSWHFHTRNATYVSEVDRVLFSLSPGAAILGYDIPSTCKSDQERYQWLQENLKINEDEQLDVRYRVYFRRSLVEHLLYDLGRPHWVHRQRRAQQRIKTESS